jgi:hypothetical protein
MVTPKLQFSGFLFDGKSAKKQPVRMELTPYHITLTFSGRSAESWPYSDIRWAAETTPVEREPLKKILAFARSLNQKD